MLTGPEIRRRDIIQDPAEHCYRHASYDLRIGHIVTCRGETVTSYQLPPHGIVEVVSRETVAVPADLQGMALVKTSLCNEGLLTLSIGIIDPEYTGPLSSYIVNFSKNTRLLQADEQFLRLVFHQLTGDAAPSRATGMDSALYLASRRRQAAGTIKDTFLDIKTVTEGAA